MIKKLSIYAEHLLYRDRYLDDLNRRIEHFRTKQSSSSSRVIDDAVNASHYDQYSVPEVHMSDLNLAFIQESMRTAGCFIVRGVFSASESARLRAYVDHAFSIGDKESGVNNYLAKQVELGPVLEATREDIKEKRKTNETYSDTVRLGKKMRRTLGQSTSCLAVESPITSYKLLEAFDAKGLKTILKGYFEHDPCVSVYKWSLRRAISPKQPIDFHQDGAFMGSEVDSINCWLALSDCGSGHAAPAMDIVPIRLKDVFGKGTGVLDWTISRQAVIDAFGEDAVVAPTFEAGDAFFFDHLLLHRTQHVEDPHAVRYAIETWFFDSENFPKNQIPILW